MHPLARRAVRTHGCCRPVRRWPRTLMTALVAGIAMGSASAASAFVYTDVVDFNLTESTRYIGPYRISSTGDNRAYYRWLDDPDHTTVISGNSCSDLALYGSATIPAHVTSYYELFTGSPYLCFMLGGRVAIGAGSMVNHDGRLKR